MTNKVIDLDKFIKHRMSNICENRENFVKTKYPVDKCGLYWVSQCYSFLKIQYFSEFYKYRVC